MASVLSLLFLAVISFNGAYSLKCFACLGNEECKSPTEVTCKEDETYCVAVNTNGSKGYFFATARNCASEDLANEVCSAVVQVNEGTCYKCQGNLCNEKLPDLE